MKFRILSVCVAALVLAGCGEKSMSAKPIRDTTPTHYDSTKTQANKATGLNSYTRGSCRNPAHCESVGDNYYANGDYTSAVYVYDDSCVRFKHLPVCIKEARMFEKGEGVEVNLNTAFELFRTTCYLGNKDGCKGRDRVGARLR